MSTLASAGSTTEDDDEDNDVRRSLLVAADGGVQRIEVGKLLDELLLECSRYRSRTKNTRDSWVQTEKDLSKCVTSSAAEETKNEEVLQPLAPLASEEEFCSGIPFYSLFGHFLFNNVYMHRLNFISRFQMY